MIWLWVQLCIWLDLLAYLRADEIRYTSALHFLPGGGFLALYHSRHWRMWWRAHLPWVPFQPCVVCGRWYCGGWPARVGGQWYWCAAWREYCSRKCRNDDFSVLDAAMGKRP